MNKNTGTVYFGRYMTRKKLKAPIIFDGYRMLSNQVLIMENDQVEDIITVDQAGDDVSLYDGMLCPGFINCHCHLELSHMKGLIPERTGLVDFVYKVVTERHHSEEEIMAAISHAEAEMLRNGIVAVGDICNNELTRVQKQKQRLRYYNFIEVSGWLPAIANDRLERSKKVYEAFSPLNSSIVPHAAYSVSNNLWKKMQPYFEKKIVSIHNQETSFEDEFFLSGKGDFERLYQLLNIDNTHHDPTKLSSLQSYFHQLKNAACLLLVHNTFIREDDIHFIKNQLFHRDNSPEVFFCICANANLYIENSLPPIDLLRRHECPLILGTDSLASNWSLDIWSEIKTIRKNFPDVPLQEVLVWATSNGAKALQMDEHVGSFEKGKIPGVLLIDESSDKVQKLV